MAALLVALVAVGVSDGRERLYDQVPNQLPSVLLAVATLLLGPLWIGWAARVRRERAGVALHVIDRRPEEAKAVLEAIRQGSAGALQELRAALGVLRHPGAGESARAPVPGLGQLDQLVAGIAGAGRTVEVVVGGDPAELPPAVDLAAYRVVQESMTNVSGMPVRPRPPSGSPISPARWWSRSPTTGRGSAAPTGGAMASPGRGNG